MTTFRLYPNSDRMRIACLLFALLLLKSMRGGAQADEPLFHRISLEQGLSDARVTSIVQDRYGFMWFGTARGLNRYDGYNIKVYGEGERGLTNSSITSLFCSKAGALYVGDGNGLLDYDYALDSFRRPKGTDSSDLNKKGFVVTLMEEDTLGRIYIGCAEGLFRYEPRSRRIEDVNQLLGSRSTIRHISGLSFGPDGRLWITTQKRGFFMVNPADATYAEIPHDRQYGNDSCCFAIHRTVFIDEHLLLLGQHSYGLTVFDTRTRKFTPQQGLLGKNDSVRFNSVYRLIRDHKGRIWGGTAYHSLIQYMPGTKEIVQYRNDPYNPFSYGGYRIYALFEDRDGNIWIGTGGYGVYRFNPDKTAIRYYPWNPLGQRSPPGAEVLSAAVRDSGTVWIGTDKGPAIFGFRDGSFKPYRYENSYSTSLPGSNINNIYRDKKGLVWMATRSLGISRFDERTQKFFRYYHREEDLTGQNPRQVKSPIPSNTITSMAEDMDGNFLFLMGSARIAIFDQKTATSRYGGKDTVNGLLAFKDVADLMRDRETLIVALKSRKSARLLSYSLMSGQQTTLADIDTGGKTRINSIMFTPDSNIAVASNDGVYIVGRHGGILKHYRWQADEIHNNILRVIPGIRGELWVCTDRHIGRIDLRSEKWSWLGNSEGLKPTRFFGNSFILLPDGRILAGSSDGLFLIRPSAVNVTLPQAPVLVEFRVFGKPFPLRAPLQDTRQIRLTYQQNFFSFAMGTLHFGESSNIEYGYMLEGYDQDWQPAGSDRNGQYTGVPGGTYSLRLRARSGTADWVESPDRVRIVIARAWWNTWAFRILMALALLGVVGIIYIYRVRSIRKAARLRSEYEIRLNELEMSALRTQMNPHFIFNCLNTINSYINSNQKTQANHYITRFAKLIRLILENSRQRRIALSKELEALHLYFQLESLRFENRFVYSIEVDDALDTDNVEVPPLVLQPFVENAILHGILPRPGSGTISVRIRQAGSLVEYVVEDDGIGRAEARKRSAEGALQKESHGMAITEKRIALFNRENGVTATVIVEDLMKDEMAAGTRVRIPLAFVEGF